MSITKRLISGSAAAWAQILVGVLAQVLLVPIYLTYWDTKTYGVWLAIQALVTIMSTLDLGHQSYLGYEFMRLGQDKIKETASFLWSGIMVSILIGLLQVLLVTGLVWFGAFDLVLDNSDTIDPKLLQSAGIVLLLQTIAWLLTGSAGGVFVRVLNAFDCYPRLAWWGVFNSIITAMAPALTIAFGVSFIITGLAAAGCTLFFNIFLYADMFKLMKRKQIPFVRPSIKLGWMNFSKSLILSIRNLLENLRVAGVRVVLGPVAGAKMISSFSTIRTGANFAMQGLHSITHPMLPELMKFLNQRDQERSETAFGTIWMVVICLIAPGIVVLQLIIEPLFLLWTRGKIPFDPTLFAVLSMGVLIYAISQPAIAVVTGNNLLKSQLWLSGIPAAIVIAGIVVLVPIMGIAGAGVALLLSEIFAMVCYNIVAKKWLSDNGLVWPVRSSQITQLSALIAIVALLLIIFFPSFKYGVLFISICLFGASILKYWNTLPLFARNHAQGLFQKLPGYKKFKLE